MGMKLRCLILWAWLAMPSNADIRDDLIDPESINTDRWEHQSTMRGLEHKPCYDIKPTARNIVRRIYAILPFFDREHANTEFLHKFRGTIHEMSEGEDLLDREAAFYSAALVPLVFLQQYRDTWCLLERVQMFVRELPGPTSRPRATTSLDSEDEELHDKKDFKYLRELIKNLG